MALVDGALALASAGWRVFPVSASTKRPRTPHGHLDATSDVERVVAWAALFNEGGGIATPTGQGLLVIDIDPRNGGEVPTWAPKTRAVRTQSGGFHLHYAIDRDIKSRAGLFGPGVDSKSHGGYVLLPPSPGYVWATGPEQGRTRLSADWLERHFAPEVAPGQGGDRLPPNRWYRGVIHTQVMSWAAYFAATLDDEEVESALWAVINQAKDAGLVMDEPQLRRDVLGALRWVRQREGSKSIA